MGVELAVAAGLALAGGATSYVQAEQRNKSIRSAKNAASEAAAVQSKQLRDQSAVESEKALRQARAIKARALVNAAGSGFDVGSGDVDALLAAIASDTDLNLSIIGQNTTNSTNLVQSRLNAQKAELNSNAANPFLSTFQGLLAGANTGFSLVSGYKSVTANNA